LVAEIQIKPKSFERINIMNIIPNESLNLPNYLCTWATQNFLLCLSDVNNDPKLLEGSTGAIYARKILMKIFYLVKMVGHLNIIKMYVRIYTYYLMMVGMLIT
jgi:hypothetical protein